MSNMNLTGSTKSQFNLLSSHFNKSNSIYNIPIPKDEEHNLIDPSHLIPHPEWWGCPNCSLNNPPENSKCYVCLNLKVSKTENPNRPWECGKCHSTNPKGTSICSFCSSSSPLSQSKGLRSSIARNPSKLSFSQKVPEETKRSIFGATLQKRGVLFRVWAPNAINAWVVGTFANLEKDYEMAKQNNSGYWEVLVDDINVKIDEPKYKYLFEIPAENNTTTEIWRNDPRSPVLSIFEDSFVSEVVDMNSFQWTDEKFQRPELRNLVLYELHIGTFGSNSIREFNGTFKSTVDKLDYLKTMGINAIEVMPLNQDFHHDETCWGYDPVSLFALHTAFGTPDDLKYLVNEAHKRGIAVILDWVPNHMGPSSILEKFDSLDGLGRYFYHDHDRRVTDFGPRLNYKDQEVRQMIKDSLEMWFEYYHFDGVRVDSTVTMRQISNGQGLSESWSLLRECTDMVKEKYPKAICIAEDLQGVPTINSICGFHSQWDPEFFAVIYHTVKTPEDHGRDMDSVCRVLTKTFTSEPISRCIYTENHDTVPEDRQRRIPTSIDQKDPRSPYATKRSIIAAALTLTAPGVPMLLQGQELLEISGPIWPVPPTVDWEAQKDLKTIFERNNFLKAFQYLIHLRRNASLNGKKIGYSKGLTGNNTVVTHKNTDAGVLIFRRFDVGGADDDVVVIVNLRNAEQKSYKFGMPAPGPWYSVFDSARILEGSFKEEKLEVREENYDMMFWSTTVRIDCYSVIILAQKSN